MPKPLSHRHRAITEDDLVFIRRLIAGTYSGGSEAMTTIERGRCVELQSAA